MTRSVNVHTYIDIDVDLEDIDTDDLIEELKSRNTGPIDNSLEDVTEMFYAFKLGKTDRAIEIAKKIACDYTGRIL
jgi:hypothetical protein